MRYYSAAQERSGWSRAADGALFVSLALALPAAWICDRQIEEVETIASVFGTLVLASDGSFIARVSNPEERLGEGPGLADENLWGFFRADVDRMKRGFPLTTSHVTRRPVVHVWPQQGRPELRETDIDAGPESAFYRDVIQPAVSASPRPEAQAVAQWFGSPGTAHTEPQWGAWAAGIMLWWVSLFAALSVLLLLMRLATFGFLRQKAAKEIALSAQGRCPFCGYDLRGLEFSERCPECGELQD